MENTGVSVFYPTPAQAATNLKNATIFTRINILAAPQNISAALESSSTLQNTFCLGHLNNILVFGDKKEEHYDHVRAVMQVLKDKDLRADIRHCAFTKSNWTEAGFQISPVGGDRRQAFMVVLREHLAPDALENTT
ncbi:MAG: hypothetical protein Q9216_002024 [Gyalolechia sp. 2 TL-2023]